MKKYIMFFICFWFLCLPNAYAEFTYVRGNIAANTTKVWVRTCASSSCGCITSDTGNDIKISYPEMFEILGEEGDFYKISVQYSGVFYTGYISKGTKDKEYVVKKEYNILDSTVVDIVNSGFPVSYASKIAIMKTVHPEWNFVPFTVNATFDEVIAGETKYASTNLVDGTNTLLRSTADDAYTDGVWNEYAGGGWYAASKQTVKFFVDPRNFLNDGHVYMFETLTFDDAIQTPELIQSLLNGSFMEGMAFKYNEAGEKEDVSYAQTFVDAGSQNGISAVHLVSRVLLEQGANGSSLSSGDNQEYPGYYNFFNVNANGGSTAEVIHNGLAYAVKKGWNSPYASIIGGGDLLNKYVREYGQITLYLQKFDLAGSSYYQTQYMQNVRSPYTESYTAYKAYAKTNLLDAKFSFAVPVFKGEMPESTSLDSKYNEDNTLSALSISECNLMPTFTSSAHEYTCTVLKTLDKVNVAGAATSSYSTVEGIGEVNITELDNITVVVTAASGDKATYTIHLNKVDEKMLTPDEILAKMQINIAGNYVSGFDFGLDAASFNNNLSAAYNYAAIEISENKVLSTGMKLKLKTEEEKEYTIIIYGDNNGDGAIDIIDLLRVQKYIIGGTSLTDGYLAASDVNHDGEVDIIDLLKIQKDILGVSKIEQNKGDL